MFFPKFHGQFWFSSCIFSDSESEFRRNVELTSDYSFDSLNATFAVPFLVQCKCHADNEKNEHDRSHLDADWELAV